MTKRKNLLLSAVLAVVMLFACVFGIFTMTKTSASAATTVSLNDDAVLKDWNDAESNGCEFLPFCIGEPGSNTLLPNWAGWYNDGIESKLQYNNNLDPLAYIYVNDTSFRDIVTANVNASAEDRYLASSGTMSWEAGWWAPVAVETNTTYGILIRIMNTYITDVLADEGKFELIFKKDFALVGQNDVTYVITEDIKYTYTNGSWVKYVPSVEYTEVSLNENAVLGDWNDAENDNCEFLPYSIGVAGTSNTFKPATALKGIYWNDGIDGKKVNNEGIDLMECMYINDKSFRTLVTENTYVGVGFPMTMGGCYAPVTVQTNDTYGILIKIYNVFIQDVLASEGKVELTLKAGLSLLGEGTTKYVLTEDITYVYNNSAWTIKGSIQTYTLSFAGTDVAIDPIAVEGGMAIANLPAVPEKEGYIGVWQIDGVDVDATTVYSYGADKTATAKYYETTDVTDDLLLHNWADENGVKRIPLTIPDAAGNNSMIPNGFTFTYWNDHPENAAINFGLDLMQYVTFNGVDTRTLVNNNENGVTSYAGGFSPLSIGGIYAPMTVEYGPALGIYICVLADYIDDLMEQDGYVTLTYKAGLSLRGDGVIYSIAEDLSYHYMNGSWVKEYTLSFEGTDSSIESITVGAGLAISNLPAVPEKEGYIGVWTIDGAEVNTTTVYSYGADKTATAVYYQITDITDELVFNRWPDDTDTKRIPLTIPDADGNNSMIPNGFTYTYWNDHPENAAINFGVDIMQYITINGVETRTIINNNRDGATSYSGGIGPMPNGGIYAPVTVEYSVALGIYVCILNSYLDDLMTNDGYVTLTYKEGLTLRGDGVAYYLAEDLGFMYVDDEWVDEYGEVIFDGIEESISVKYGEAFGELPPVPEKAGYTGYWKVGEERISAETVRDFAEYVVATAAYEANSYTLSFENGEEVISDINVTYDAAIGELPALTEQIGYVAYWAIDGEEITADTIWAYAENKTAVAVYEIGEYVLSFDGLEETMDVVYGESIGALPALTEREGYTVAWTIDGTPIVEGMAWEFIGDKTAVVTYTAKTFELEFVNGEETVETLTVTYDAAIGELPAVPEKSGYTGVWTLDGEEITADTVWTYVENKTAVAEYTGSVVVVTFDGENPVEVVCGEKLTAPEEVPTQEATNEYTYEFDGWYYGDTKWDFENDVVEGAMNLEARFTETKVEYTITFNVTGNDNVKLDSVKVAYGENYDLTKILDDVDVTGYSYSITVDGKEKASIRVVGDVTVEVTFTEIAENEADTSEQASDSSSAVGFSCMGSVGGIGIAISMLTACGVALSMKKKRDEE